MKVLFDQGVPVPLRRELRNHTVDTVHERAWSDLENGDLLDAAETDGYEVLITTDQNIKHQQNLAGREISIVVLMSTAWPKIKARASEIAGALTCAKPGAVIEVPI